MTAHDVISAICTEGDIGNIPATNPQVEPVEIEARSFHPMYEWRKKSNRGQRGPSCNRDRQRKAAKRFVSHGHRKNALHYSIEVFGELSVEHMKRIHEVRCARTAEEVFKALYFAGIDTESHQWETLLRTGELGIRTDKYFILVKELEYAQP